MISIREAVTDDEQAVYALALDFPSPTQIDKEMFSQTWAAKFTDANAFTCVAEHTEELIAYAAGYRHRSFYANGFTFWVDEIMVDAAFRDRGIGRKLMHAIEQWAVARQCKQVLLASSNAKGFHEGLGFKNTADYFKKVL